MLTTRRPCGLLIFALLDFGSARADTHDLWLASSPLLVAGATYVAAFDTHFLFDPKTERIDEASLTPYFSGEERPVFTETAMVQTGQGQSTATFDANRHYADAPESVVVLMDGANGASPEVVVSSPYYDKEVVVSTVDVYETRTSCQPFVGCTPYDVFIGTDRAIDHLAGHGGSFAYTATLDATALSTFSSTGLLHYGFTVAEGRVQLSSAEVVFITSPVPEPPAVALMVAGLDLAARLRRRLYSGSSGVATRFKARPPAITGSSR